MTAIIVGAYVFCALLTASIASYLDGRYDTFYGFVDVPLVFIAILWPVVLAVAAMFLLFGMIPEYFTALGKAHNEKQRKADELTRKIRARLDNHELKHDIDATLDLLFPNKDDN